MLEYFKQPSVEFGMAWGKCYIWISKLAGKDLRGFIQKAGIFPP